MYQIVLLEGEVKSHKNYFERFYIRTHTHIYII